MELQKTLTMNLPVPLDQKQKAELGQRMSEVEILINQKEQSKKSITKKYSEEIENLEAELYGLAKQFENNAVNAEIECRVDFNLPEKGKKTITRLDTNEEVKVYDMSPEEIKAIEEPDLFDPANSNFPTRIFGIYGVEVDKIFQPEEYEANVFIVKSLDDLTAHEIDIEPIDEDIRKELLNCLALRIEDESELAINENIPQVFAVASAESETLSWKFFKELTPKENVIKIEFNTETMDMDDIIESYSGDVLIKDKIRSHFLIEETMYVTTGTVGDGHGSYTSAMVYELIPAKDYEKETHGYNDAVTGKLNPYEGQLITYRKKEYVLSNKTEIVFSVESEVLDELKKYELPEKEV